MNGWTYRVVVRDHLGNSFTSQNVTLTVVSGFGTIVYNGGGHTSGTVPASHQAPLDVPTALRAPGTMARAGYTFSGWRSSSSGNIFQPGQTVTFRTVGTVTYTAVWTRNPVTGTVVYNGGGHTSGTVPAHHTVTIPGTITLRQPGNLARTGYTFAGWRAPNGTVFQSGQTVTINTAGTTTYTAVWTRNQPANITLSFNSNFGFVDTMQMSVRPGAALPNLPIPTRTGHQFIDWVDTNIPA